MSQTGPRVGHAGAAAAMLAAASLVASSPSVHGEPGRPAAEGLAIAILDLAEAPDLAPQKPVRAAPAPWRTSFGSERRTTPKAPPAPPAGDPLALLAEVDAVLIQGVHAPAALRRLFPPRTWRLVLSRHLGAAARYGKVLASDTASATTAIAIKAEPHLRVTARLRELRLDAPDAAGAASATAIRLAEAGRVIWLASVALPPSCGLGSACAARAGLEAWRETKRGEGAVTLVGGRTWTGTSEPRAAPSPCGAHAILSDLRAQPVSLDPADGSGDGRPVSGCISIVRLPD